MPISTTPPTIPRPPHLPFGGIAKPVPTFAPTPNTSVPWQDPLETITTHAGHHTSDRRVGGSVCSQNPTSGLQVIAQSLETPSPL
jgi:hypothetical protein